MADRWLSKSEVVAVTGWASRTIERKANEGALASREGKQGKNGKPKPQYALSTLPKEAQDKYLASQIASAFRGSATTASSSRVLVCEDDQQQAARRAASVKPLIDFQLTASTTIDGLDFSNLQSLAEHLAAKHPCGVRTLWRWYALYKKHGLSGLADKPRSDRGASRVLAGDVRAFVENKYLAEDLSITLVHDALAREWPKLRECADQRVPSYDAVRRYLKSLPSPIAVLAREGSRAFGEKVLPFIQRDYTKLRANEIWQSDHMQHDVVVRNDCFSAAAPNAPLRLYLTSFLDMRSRKIVGYSWSVNPSSQSICSALRSAIANYGLCGTVYIDNGKDYKKIGRDALEEQLSGVLVRLGIGHQYCLPYHPQSKEIESFHRTLHQRFDVIFRPYYSGTSPKDRPEEYDDVRAEHAKLLKAGAPGAASPLIPASEFMAMAAVWIEKNYNAEHKHSGQGMRGKTPNEVYDADYPVADRRTCDPRDLDQLLWDRQKRVVREGQTLVIHNSTFEPADGQGAARLFEKIGREVIIACDPQNLGDAIALDDDGNLLAVMRAQKLLEHGPVSKEDVRRSMRLRGRVERATREYIAANNAQQTRAGFGTEIDHLRAAAGLDKQPKRQRFVGLPAVASARRASPAAAPVYVNDIVEEWFKEEGD